MPFDFGSNLIISGDVEAEEMGESCVCCGKPLSIFEADILGGLQICSACKAMPKAEREKSSRAHEELRSKAKGVLLTTTPALDGYRIRKCLGIESVEFVIGTGIFSEVSSSISDFFGRRSTAFEKKLGEAKHSAFEALRILAVEKGANAVIGIDLDYVEFSGNRVALIVNGTLVQLVKNDAKPSADNSRSNREG